MLHPHTIRVKGSRYFVFNEDYYNASGGMFDCELITDDFAEAESLAIKLSKQEYFPSSVSLFDVVDKKYYSFSDGSLDENMSNHISFYVKE